MSIWLENRDRSKNNDRGDSGAVSNGHATEGGHGRNAGSTDHEDEQTPLLHA